MIFMNDWIKSVMSLNTLGCFFITKWLIFLSLAVWSSLWSSIYTQQEHNFRVRVLNIRKGEILKSHHFTVKPFYTRGERAVFFTHKGKYRGAVSILAQWHMYSHFVLNAVPPWSFTPRGVWKVQRAWPFCEVIFLSDGQEDGRLLCKLFPVRWPGKCIHSSPALGL